MSCPHCTRRELLFFCAPRTVFIFIANIFPSFFLCVSVCVEVPSLSSIFVSNTCTFGVDCGVDSRQSGVDS